MSKAAEIADDRWYQRSSDIATIERYRNQLSDKHNEIVELKEALKHTHLAWFIVWVATIGGMLWKLT